MRKRLFASAFTALAAGFFASSVMADDALVRFQGAIGDIPVANVAGMANPDGTFPDVTRNIVRLVNPAGQIWVISAFSADVKVDGRIHVDGRGLLLGGGNAIGTNGNASVFATLICEAAAPFTLKQHEPCRCCAGGQRRLQDRRRAGAGATGRVRQPRAPHPHDGERGLVCCGHPQLRSALIKRVAKALRVAGSSCAATHPDSFQRHAGMYE